MVLGAGAASADEGEDPGFPSFGASGASGFEDPFSVAGGGALFTDPFDGGSSGTTSPNWLSADEDPVAFDSESVAFAPVSESVAFAPVSESVAFAPVSESVAFDSESVAFAPVSESAVDSAPALVSDPEPVALDPVSELAALPQPGALMDFDSGTDGSTSIETPTSATTPAEGIFATGDEPFPTGTTFGFDDGVTMTPFASTEGDITAVDLDLLAGGPVDIPDDCTTFAIDTALGVPSSEEDPCGTAQGDLFSGAGSGGYGVTGSPEQTVGGTTPEPIEQTAPDAGSTPNIPTNQVPVDTGPAPVVEPTGIVPADEAAVVEVETPPGDATFGFDEDVSLIPFTAEDADRESLETALAQGPIGVMTGDIDTGLGLGSPVENPGAQAAIDLFSGGGTGTPTTGTPTTGTPTTGTPTTGTPTTGTPTTGTPTTG
ncbi:MAG: hypothetical protein AVDCRST_MAG66-1692, partial [uncultured Pseudonocardia sp.]